MFVSPATRWLACTQWGDIPTVVGDAWGCIIKGSSLSRISSVRSPTILEVAPRSTSLISDRVRDLLEDLPDPLLLPHMTQVLSSTHSGLHTQEHPQRLP